MTFTYLKHRVVWIHGGGYTLGWKTQYGSGVGLINASRRNNKESIIYVAINYRLGLFVRSLSLVHCSTLLTTFSGLPIREDLHAPTWDTQCGSPRSKIRT